jgi:adenylate cyclase, class 2
MKTEIEAKFLDVDFDEIRAKLTKLGATLEQPMRLMRRYTFDNAYMKRGKDSFVRVRDEGSKVTATYKQFDSLSLHGTKEIEIEVNDFEQTVSLMREIGAGEDNHSYQESKRETWRLDQAEIVLDEWPWLKPYIEIEGDTEEAVRQTADLLGLSWDDAAFGDVMVAYRAEYPHLEGKHTIGTVTEVRFGDPLPDVLKASRE